MAAAMMCASLAAAAPACDALQVAVDQNEKSFSLLMQTVYPFMDAKSCDYDKKNKVFDCSADFTRASAAAHFGSSAFNDIVIEAGAEFVKCGATLTASRTGDNEQNITLKVPVGKKTLSVELDAGQVWDDDPDDIMLMIEVTALGD